MRFSTIVSVVTLVWGISPRQPSGKNIIRWLLKKRTNGSVRYCQYTSVLGLARSSYFYHRAALKAGDKYATIRKMLTDIFNSNYQCYGYRRLHAMLRHEGGRLSEKVVRRLMVEEQLVVSRNRRRRYSSYCGEIGPAPDNLIARDFKAEQPNQK
ncbi:IS1353 transposase [Shigella sonnei]|nr:IS1353 transposase [Shigella sonnei]CSK83750.1 IS1353 transposase [Shigella sonnei]